MKKVILLLVFDIMLLSSASIAYIGGTTKEDAYMTYYDFIIQEMRSVGKLVEEVKIKPEGYVDSENMEWHYDGVNNVIMHDLDDDGIPELIMSRSLYHDNKNDVFYPSELHKYSWRHSQGVTSLYTYKNGKIQLIEGHMPWGTDGERHISTGTDGKTYLYTFRKDVSDITTFYQLRNGQLSAIDKIEIYFSPDWYVSLDLHSSYGEYVYFTGNENYINSFSSLGISLYDQWQITKKDYDKIFNKYTSKGDLHYIIADYQCKTEQQASSMFKSLVPDKFLDGYNNPSNWAKEVVQYAIDSNVVPKDIQRMYNQPIRRVEFCQLAAQYFEVMTGQELIERMTFFDTEDISVQKMGALGIITGVGNGFFNPNGFLTREEAAVILARLSQALGRELVSQSPTFSDNDDIAKWATDSVGMVQHASIMNGVGNNYFSPKSYYTLEQSISTLMDLGEKQNIIDDFKIIQDNIELLPSWKYELEIQNNDKKVLPSQLFSWYSEDESVVSVDPKSGLVVAKSAGTTNIIAKSPSGTSASCKIIVLPLATEHYYVEFPEEMVYYTKNPYPSLNPDFDAELAGKIFITDIKEESYTEKELIISATVTRNKKIDYKYVTPRFKYYIEAANGAIVSVGTSSINDNNKWYEYDKNYKKIEFYEREITFKIQNNYYLNRYHMDKQYYDLEYPFKIIILNEEEELPKITSYDF